MAIAIGAVDDKFVDAILQVEDLMGCAPYRKASCVTLTGASVQDGKLVLNFEPGKPLNPEDCQYLGDSDTCYEVSLFDLELGDDGNSLRANLFMAGELVQIQLRPGVDIKSILQSDAVLATA